jgi:hypothetical protein
MILTELNKVSNRWAQDAQLGIVEANVTALGSTSDTYTVSFKNGGKTANISGPTGLSVGNAVIVAHYPGKAKKFVILQKAKGGGTQTITTVSV